MEARSPRSGWRRRTAGCSCSSAVEGRRTPPGSFPRSPIGFKKNFWDPSNGRHGLFNIWSFRDIEAVVASGLGGGSLIYANVLLRKDEKWFVRPRTPSPADTSTGPSRETDLEPHYDQVERMLGAQRYPLAYPGYDTTTKTLALRDAAEQLGLDWQLPKLAVTFANEDSPPRIGEPIQPGPYPNIHGPHVVRNTCRLTGECDLGCNSGSKNTLDHNYLSAAKHFGADIRTRCEVRQFEPMPKGGYRSPTSNIRPTGTACAPRRPSCLPSRSPPIASSSPRNSRHDVPAAP